MKKVFISHSSEDANTAMALCVYLESHGIPCWLAPRDISYGEKWAEEIAASLLSSTGLFLFLLSENSNRSKQVLKEINIAIDNDIPMLIVSISEVPKLNLSLVYYLSNLHIYSCTVDETDDWKERIANLISKKEAKISESLNASAVEHPEGHKPVPVGEYNLTDEMDKKYHDLFDDEAPDDTDNDNTDKELSIKENLLGIMGRNLIRFWAENQHKTDGDDMLSKDGPVGGSECSAAEPDDNRTARPDPFNPNGIKESFCLPHSNGQATLVFRVDYNIDPVKRTRTYYAEQLETEEQQADDEVSKSRYVITAVKEEEQLLLLTFVDEKSVVFVNSGLLFGQSIKVSKTPTALTLESIFGKDPGRIHRYRINSGHNYITIDPEKKTVLKPYTVYNEETDEYETFIDLIQYKHYFTFQIRDDDSENVSDFELGYAYYMGVNGLDKNWFLAAEYLMKTDSPESDYYLGYIFTFDPLLKDPELAAMYIDSAISRGVEEAKLLLT